MSQSGTYASLVSRIEALYPGADDNSALEGRVKQLINSRAWWCYRETDYWPNQLVIGEERAVNGSTNTVPYTGAAYDATESGTLVNPYDAPVDSFLRIHRENPWNQKSVTEYEFACDSNGARIIGYRASYGLSTAVSAANTAGGAVTIDLSGALDVYVGSTVKLEGLDEGTGIPDLNGTHTVTAVQSGAYPFSETIFQFAISDVTNYSFSISGDETCKAPVAFCTYKQRLDGTTYGTDSGETSDVPREWFEAIAHGVLADMLRADDKFEAAQLEETTARMKLQQELERIDRMHVAQSVGKRIQTHGSEQARVAENF